VAGSDPALVTAMVAGNGGPTADALDRVLAQLERPWPDLVADGHAVRAAWPTAPRRPVRLPLDRSALLTLGRAGGAVTHRLAAFLEGWVPGDP
jgi:prephenate dehydrogenase